MQPTPSKKWEQANRAKQAELDRLASLKAAAKPEGGAAAAGAGDKKAADAKLPDAEGSGSTS